MFCHIYKNLFLLEKKLIFLRTGQNLLIQKHKNAFNAIIFSLNWKEKKQESNLRRSDVELTEGPPSIGIMRPK